MHPWGIVIVAALAGAACSVDAQGLRPPQGPSDGAPLTAIGDAGDLDLDRERVPVLAAGVSCQPGDAVVRTTAGWECEAPGGGGAPVDHAHEAAEHEPAEHEHEPAAHEPADHGHGGPFAAADHEHRGDQDVDPPVGEGEGEGAGPHDHDDDYASAEHQHGHAHDARFAIGAAYVKAVTNGGQIIEEIMSVWIRTTSHRQVRTYRADGTTSLQVQDFGNGDRAYDAVLRYAAF